MQADSSPKTDAEISHYKRVSTSLELYASILSRSREMVSSALDIKGVLHDGERRLVLDVARDIFRVTVDETSLAAIVAELPSPDIETIAVSRPPAAVYEAAPGEDGTTQGMKVAGF